MKREISEEWSVSGSMWIDFMIGLSMGPIWYLILVCFYSF